MLDLFALRSDADGAVVPVCFAADRLHLAAPGHERCAAGLKAVLKGPGIE